MTDPRNSLVWKRCIEGANWNGSSCSKTGKQVDWFEAMQLAKASKFLNFKDWRLPSSEELQSIVGEANECEKNVYQKGKYAASQMIAYAIGKEDQSPAQIFSFTTANDSNYALTGWLGGGGLLPLQRDSRVASAQLVRANYSRDSENRLLFESEFAKIPEYKRASSAKISEYLRSSAEKTKREAQERRDQVARDEQYRRDAPARQARQMCEAQKQTCFASCPPYRSVDWRENSLIVNGAHFDCKSRCGAISCN